MQTSIDAGNAREHGKGQQWERQLDSRGDVLLFPCDAVLQPSQPE